MWGTKEEEIIALHLGKGRLVSGEPSCPLALGDLFLPNVPPSRKSKLSWIFWEVPENLISCFAVSLCLVLVWTQRAFTYIAGAEGFQVSSILGDVLGQVLLLCWSFQADFPLQQPHDVLFNQAGMDLVDDSLLGRRGG